MKNLCTLAFILLLIVQVKAQNLSFEPEQPAPGQEVKITYDPTGTALEGINHFETTAYLYEDKYPTAIPVEMVKNGTVYTGVIETKSNSKALYIGLKHPAKDAVDDNNKKGYGTLFYKDGKVIPGAYANKALIYSGLGRYANVEVDREKALRKMQKEFSMYPESKSNGAYQIAYANLGKRLENSAVTEEVKQMIEIALKVKKSEKTWMNAHQLSTIIGDEEQTAAIEKKIKKKFPKGELVAKQLEKQFYEEKEVDKKVVLFNKFKALKYGDDKATTSLENMSRTIVYLYSKKGEYNKAEPFVEGIKNKSRLASTYNQLAWPMSGESIEGEAKDLEQAKKYSAQSIKLTEMILADPMLDKPAQYTPAQWKRQMEFTLGMYADTYALISYKSGNYKDALKYQQIAGEVDKFHDGTMNYRYAMYLEKVKGAKEAEAWMESMIRKGTANEKMIRKHKETFLANHTMETVYEKFIAELENDAKEKQLEDLKKKMINEKAPDFELVNLDGKVVSSADMDGKIVIVDFWATWCGPCVASFPGMQMAVNKFKENEDVVFLFVNTWENAKDKKKNAADFIKEKGYTFNVPLDEKDKVVSKFGVQGIPTKFIIDGNGNIRFKSVGFSGNDRALVEELNRMIQLIEADTQPGADD